MKIAYWGSGPISNFHISALRHLEVDIISCFSRENSSNLLDFSSRHNIQASKTEDEFLNRCDDADAVFVALKTEHTLEALEKLKGNYKVFFEKPGSLASVNLKSLKGKVRTENFFSLYNRRFYSTVTELKLFIEASKCPVNLNIFFPDTKKGIHQFLINGCHAVDLGLYLIDDFDPKVDGVVGSKDEASAGFSFLATSKNGGMLNFNNPWGAPSRARVDCYNSEHVIQLMPFESLQLSDSMIIKEPTNDVPIRTYLPNKVKEQFVDSTFKPGFLDQANATLKCTSGNYKDPRLCSFDQSVKVLEFMEKILSMLR